ncbi:GPI ethanolamine phosphate transferase 2/3 subunit F [Geosmithia morbida]|uniref:GPI ethanolamine phosphate transferase 2/3 subunit F n=1 Tax=Geosmithia morbida TaxID=1094350 RepID=A0A9P4YWC6_9HYPO|nr:GPI ethanolamine phosphate transferase 2/3 subunit F [Geosmithia morbida]KAF4124313.1 GPI ethanolamine phosphate transferase 2/3 subunit F [Geosmithia morbida]
MPSSAADKTAAVQAATESKASPATQALQPISTVDSPASRAVGWLRPAILVGGCLARLPALVEDPTSALQTALPAVAAVQVVYAVMGSSLLCAAHMATLGIFPVFYTRGLDGQALLAVAGAYAPLDDVFGGLLGAALGSWLGAVPIPLDWDRPWQTWPVTIVVGMYIGNAVLGSLLGGPLHGKRLVGSGDGVDEEEQ